MENNNGAANGYFPQESNRINIKDIFYQYLKFLWIYPLLIGAFMIGCWIYIRYANEKYSTSATLLINNNKTTGSSNSEFFEDLIMGGGGRSNIQDEMEILKSRTLMGRVVRSLGLQTKYYVKGNIKESNMYKSCPFVLDVLQLNDSTQAFTINLKFEDQQKFRVVGKNELIQFNQIFKNELGTFRLRPSENSYILGQYKEYYVIYLPVESAAGGLAGSVKVTNNRDFSYILKLSIITDHPVLCEDILNQLMLEYDKANLEEKQKTGFATIAFINERLKLLGTELGDVEKNIQEFKESSNVINLSAQSNIFFDKLNEVEKNITEQAIKLRVADMVSDYVTDKADVYKLVPTNLGIEDITLVRLVTQYNDAINEREKQLATGATVQNQGVIKLEDQIERTRNAIIESVGIVRKTFQSTYNDLKLQSQTLQSQIKSVPFKERLALEKGREQNIKESLYLYLLRKKEEVSVSLASSTASSRIVDKAIANYGPISPQRKNLYMIAFLAGIFIATFIIYLINSLNDKVTSRFEIERITDTPIIGEVGHSQNTNTLVVSKTSRDLVSEQFRIVRSNLQFVLNNVAKPVIVVTSSLSGEGKSFVTTNLGAVMAISGKRTIILEFDLRKPKILSGLNISRRTGITNYFVGSAEIEELITPVPGTDNLFVIACGPIPPNPSEMLLSPSLNKLLTYLKEHFDVVLIDTAPVGLVSDAIELGKLADCTLFIVRQRYTYKKLIHLLDELYKSKKLPRPCILMNDVRMDSGYGYYGYRSYGYGYGYGYYIVNENTLKKKSFLKRMRKKIGEMFG